MKTKIGIISFFLSLLFFALFIFKPIAFAVDAQLILPGVQQFFDNNGNPLSGGKVYFYEVGTTTFKDTYTSSTAGTTNANPITLNAGGKAPTGGIWGIGLYRQIVKDKNGNLIWDAVTETAGGSTTPTLVGDGNLVGTVLPWSGIVAPNQYVFTYGQEIARATYPDFYTAVTQQLNVICTASSNTLTGISDTSQIRIGSPIEAALCVVAGTTVVSKTSSTVVLSNPSSVTINTTATFFPWGNGDGSTTFNVPDFRGYVMAGRDNMGGTAANILTTTYFGTNSPNALGATGGSESHTMTISEMVAHKHTASSTSTVNDPGHTHAHNQSVAGTAGGSANVPVNGSGALVTGSNTTGITVGTVTTTTVTGSTVPFTIVQPTITLNYVVKITPDVSTSVATGVASLGGMTGVISCGTGLLCTGNIISFNEGSLTGTAFTAANDTNVTATLTGSPTVAVLSPMTFTLGWTGQLGLTRGGTANSLTASNGGIVWSDASKLNILSGTATANLPLLSGSTATPSWATIAYPTIGVSGGIAYFSSSTVISASSLLTANQIMIGGGAGVAPNTFACATTTTVVHGGTPPTCSQIVAGDITTNTITNSNLAQVAAVTLKGNPTNATANISDFTISSLTQTTSPNAADMLLIWDSVAGIFKKITPSSIATVATAGVSSLNSQTGGVTLATTSGININTTAVGTITISPDIATAANFEAGTANKLLDANVVFTTETTTITSSTTSLDFNTFINTKFTLSGNTTLSCSNIKAGQAGQIRIIQDTTGSRVITPNSAAGWCSQFRFASASIPTLTTSASAVDILNYSCPTTSYCQVGLAKGFNP